MNPCLLVPIFDHGDRIRDVVEALAPLELPCLIVDDGSAAATRTVLAAVAAEYPWVTIERLPENRGRGGALRHGYAVALRRGFSHAVQLDADGQHDAADVPRFLEAIRRRPEALVLGAPVFDAGAPWSRLIGRQISKVWVHVETLSLAIEDPLCGFRGVPLAPAVALLARSPLGDHMEFDPEFAVRMAWAGVPVVNVPTRVRYVPGGLSHFQMLWDNLRITGAHTRLVLGMLRRLAHRLWARRVTA